MLLLVVLFARGGIDGLLAGRAVADALLQIDGLTKRFGGVVASDDIALDVPPGELHAIIGPNGAGKTTLIGQLTGELAPDAGRIRFAGQTSPRCRPGAQRARARALVPDHVAVPRLHRARQRRARRAGACRPLVPLLARRARGSELREPARAALGARRPRRPRRHASSPTSATASTASSRSPWRSPPGRACCCSTSRWPGMGPEESARMVGLLRELKQRAARSC